MKRFSISAILVVFSIVFVTLPVKAADDNIRGARYAPHLILPLLGYQSIDNEMSKFDYDIHFKIVIENIDSLEMYRDSSETFERSRKSPMLGFTYRFRPNHSLNIDATFAMLHDAATFKYKASFPIFDYSTETYEMTIKRSNMLFGALDLGYNIPLPMKWFGLSIIGGAGYAYRKIESEDIHQSGQIGNIYIEADIVNTNEQADGILFYRGGFDLSLWKSDNLIIQGSIFYTQYQPSDSEIDPFGGIGWKLCLFPIWFEL
ncbi:hypothetical protein K9N50_09790 [bacterium]|nr:hypothetical protein [bacterium]